LASIRQWLEEEGGVIVTVQSLGSYYLTRIRRKEKATAVSPIPPLAEPLAEAKLPSAPSSRERFQERAQKKLGFEYPPGPPDESKLI